jgi:hypothetical protein
VIVAPAGEQLVDQHPARRLAHVVGVRLERKAQSAKRRPASDSAEALRDLAREDVLLRLVAASTACST